MASVQYVNSVRYRKVDKGQVQQLALRQDLNGRSILAVVATKQDDGIYLLKLEDVSLKERFEKEMVESIKQSLDGIHAKYINAIISDLTMTHQAARKNLTCFKSHYHHLIDHRCVAHFINLTGSKITEEECFKDLMNRCSRLFCFISNNTYLVALLREAGAKRLVKATPVRWDWS